MNQSLILLEARSEKTVERLKHLENRMGELETLFNNCNRRWNHQWKLLLKRLDALEQGK